MTPITTASTPKVIVVSPWYGGNEGGVAVVAESLVQSLIQEGIPCAAIIVAADGLKPAYNTGQSGEQIVTLCVRDAGSATDFRAKVGVEMREFIARRAFRGLMPTDGRPCVVHLHYSTSEYSFFAKLCGELNIPMITTFHGSDLTVNLEDARTRDVTRAVVQQCKVVTAVSAALRETAISTFPEIASHTEVVHNSVPPDFVAAAEAAPATDRDIDVLYVGNLIPRKGVDVLLHAWHTVIRDSPDAKLVVAGGGEDAQMLSSLARELNIEHSVSFTGRQSREALPALYKRAKVLVVPSRNEPLGVVVLEGMLCGAAVVASATGGIPEIITDNEHGVLVPVEDSLSLAKGIARLLNDEVTRNRFAAAGRARVQGAFSSSGIAKQYRAIYERALTAVARS